MTLSGLSLLNVHFSLLPFCTTLSTTATFPPMLNTFIRSLIWKTIIGQVAECLPSAVFAVIVAVPLPMPFTVPLLLTVTTIADANHNNVTKNATITVNKVDSTLTVEDIVFDYGSSGSAVVSFNGAGGVNASVVGQPKAVVKVNSTNIAVSGLGAGTYT